MKVSILQYDIQWMDHNANINIIADYLQNQTHETDLLVLPEMFLTGFNMKASEASIAENHPSILKLIELCTVHKIAIIGSLAIKEDTRYFNRMMLINNSGIIDRYDKQFLFSPSGENEVFSIKHITKLIEYMGWKILPQVCYDLRFPENVRPLPNPDLLIYSANWPAPRIAHWDALLQARAIENQCFTIGCNRMGMDNNGWEFPGHSQLIKPNGKVTKIEEDTRALEIEINLETVIDYRKKYPFYKDKN